MAGRNHHSTRQIPAFHLIRDVRSGGGPVHQIDLETVPCEDLGNALSELVCQKAGVIADQEFSRTRLLRIHIVCNGLRDNLYVGKGVVFRNNAPPAVSAKFDCCQFRTT